MQEIQKLLNSEDVEVRRGAVEGLRGTSSEEAIPLLLKALADKSWRIRKIATQILISGYPRDLYIKGLFRLLYQDEDAGARNAAIETLVKLGKQAIPDLMEAFDTPNRDVRKFVIDIIGEIKDRHALPLLLKSLKDDDDNVRASAVEQLGQLAEPAVVDELIGILTSGDIWTAFPAADALGRIGDRRAIPALVEALSVRALREPVLKSLGRLSDVETLKNVVPLLSDKSKAIQELTVKAIEMFYHNGVSAEIIADSLYRFCGPDSINILIAHAWSKKRDVRTAAIFLLGLMQDERALSPLLDLFSEEDLGEEVKRALIFIGRNKPEYLVPLFQTDNQHQKRFITEVASAVASPLYYPVFEKNLSDGDGHVRALSAEGLANIGDERAVEPLKKMLSDPYEDVQEVAVKALSKLKKYLRVPEFIDYLKDRNPSLRKNAALILGRIVAKDAVPALSFALKDDHLSVRSAVVRALSSIKGVESVKHLMFALTDENPDIRASAALSLGTLGGEGVYDSLSILIQDSHDAVRAAAARALGMVGDERALKHLIDLLLDQNGFVVTTAMEAIGRLGGEVAREALVGMLLSRDAEIRRTAIQALSSFDDTEDIILPYLGDVDWAARIAAVEALGKKVTDKVEAAIEKLYGREDDPAVRRTIEEHFHVR
ncbi:MAG: HEAT repeat domain-containing protein [Thermodesulfovibrionales bacterium]|jgi:HEAT repeat protein